jgi:hypothetical protein
LDIIEGRPPFRTLARDITPTIVAGTAVTFASGVLPSGLLAGDFVCLAQESPVAQLPDGFQPALTLAACANALDSLNQPEKAQAKRQQAGAKAGAALMALRSRVKGGTRKINNGMDKWRSAGDALSWWRPT